MRAATSRAARGAAPSTASCSRRASELERAAAGAGCASTTCATSSRWSRRRRWTRRTRSRSSRTCRSTCWSRCTTESDSEPLLARVKVPIGAGMPRFLRVGDDADVRRCSRTSWRTTSTCCSPAWRSRRCELFRVTRNADHRARRGGGRRPARDDRDRAARAQVRAGRAARRSTQGMQPLHRGMLAAELGLDEATDVFEVDGHARACAT